MKTFIVFIVGRIRSGKDTVAGMLAELFPVGDVLRVNFSDSIREVLDIYDVPPDREAYSEFATALKTTRYGQFVFPRAVTKKLRELSPDVQIAVICGGRYLWDLTVLGGYDAFIVGVEAPLEIRYARGDGKDNAPTLDAFRKADSAPTEGEIDLLITHADLIVQNDGTLADLRERLQPVVDRLLRLPQLQEK